MTDEAESNDQEIHVKSNLPIMVKTDSKGIIEYANEYFIELSGYDIGEIIGKDIGIIKHPNMPDTVFNHIWENLLKKRNTKAIIKNISKNGNSFWLQAKFDFKVNQDTREIENFYAYYSPISEKSRIDLGKLYGVISKIEEHTDTDIAETYFSGYLEENSFDYSSFVDNYYQHKT